MSNDPMRENLIALAEKLSTAGITLTIGGGYGLILKAEYIRERGLKTRFADFPDDRSTNDIDIFLNTEIITNVDRLHAIRDALSDLGFKPTVPNMQFAKILDDRFPGRTVKVDLLAAPYTSESLPLLQIKSPRVKAKDAQGIHAYLTMEAVTLDDALISTELRSAERNSNIRLPHPFTYLVLKLFALRDRLGDEEKDYGAYHAFDILRIIAMTTEQEWKDAIRIRNARASEPKIIEAAVIVDQLFATTGSPGVARIRQHAKTVGLPIDNKQIDSVIVDLAELFPLR